MPYPRTLHALVLVAASTVTLPAQEPVSEPGGGELRVFLDCGFCDFDYVRTETPWVSYVRDRTAADVHVLVTRLNTGAGGSEYTLDFVGRGPFAGLTDTLRYVSRPTDTDEVVRAALTRTIQLGLVPYAARTPQGAGLRVSYSADAAAAPAMPADDPWHAWVFSVGASTSLQRESRQNEFRFSGDFGARRITPEWKFGVSGYGSVERERFTLEDRVVTSRRESYQGGVVAVRSLGDHWGAGAEAVVSSSTFRNTELAVRAAPAVEYSVWPYEVATRRQLTLQYSVGVSSFRYREETIFDRLRETRPTQSFVVGYDVRQPWGSADAELEAAAFLDDLTQNRLEFDAGLDVRLVRGLTLRVGGNASLIRDQLSIVKRDATPEEILLQRRALRTDYRYSAYVGLSYTFGSIFNSVVNPRFGSGPGNILQ
ncbi:MAG TPA: hypothetical protein VFS08_14080 [Gemmatimonadaceae bacterium]|nr:hypothetical protein [Gemmatimonadaceae bacterium]